MRALGFAALPHADAAALAAEGATVVRTLNELASLLQPIALRPAMPEDAPALAECARLAYQHYVPRMPLPPGPMLLDYAQVMREHDVTVAEAGGRLAGFVVLTEDEEGFRLWIVGVDPAFQGRGVGRALLQFAEAEARRRGFDSIHLSTHETMTENQALYARIGYREYARRREDGYARVYMRKALG
jgi:ribosomal protein S18 acetylase RimI-like enzyme